MKLSDDQKEDIKLIARSKRTSSEKLIDSYLAEMIQRDMYELLNKNWTTNATDYLCSCCHQRSVRIELINDANHELFRYCKEQPRYVAQCISCEAESTPQDTPGLARRNVLPYEDITKIKSDFFLTELQGETKEA